MPAPLNGQFTNYFNMRRSLENKGVRFKTNNDTEMAAHFIAYQGFREALHGHNYRVSIEAQGSLGRQGYVVDFGVLKRIARRLCARLDERTLIPVHSDCLEIRHVDDSVIVRYEADEFRFPKGDVMLLPIVHTSVEELALLLRDLFRQHPGHVNDESYSEIVETSADSYYGQGY